MHLIYNKTGHENVCINLFVVKEGAMQICLNFKNDCFMRLYRRRRAISFVLTQSLTKVKTLCSLFQPPRYAPTASYEVSNTPFQRSGLCMTCIVLFIRHQDRSCTGLLSKLPKVALSYYQLYGKGTERTCLQERRSFVGDARPFHQHRQE